LTLGHIEKNQYTIKFALKSVILTLTSDLNFSLFQQFYILKITVTGHKKKKLTTK